MVVAVDVVLVFTSPFLITQSPFSVREAVAAKARPQAPAIAEEGPVARGCHWGEASRLVLLGNQFVI